MITLRNVLVPTDFSECSDAAVRYGARVAGTDTLRGYLRRP